MVLVLYVCHINRPITHASPSRRDVICIKVRPIVGPDCLVISSLCSCTRPILVVAPLCWPLFLVLGNPSILEGLTLAVLDFGLSKLPRIPRPGVFIHTSSQFSFKSFSAAWSFRRPCNLVWIYGRQSRRRLFRHLSRPIPALTSSRS